MYKTPQEELWAGNFGEEYSERNKTSLYLASNLALFSRIFANRPVASLIEFGANIGNNLEALQLLLPNLKSTAVEINHFAAETLREKGLCQDIHEQSILDFVPERTWDVALIKGVLIHLNPEFLPQVYEKLFNAAEKYICIVEYYNPTPVEIRYRGREGYLFKRDFAGEMLDRYPELELVDYGFFYHRDRSFPQDDTTWFLLKKKVREN